MSPPKSFPAPNGIAYSYRERKRDRTLGDDDMPLTKQTLLNQIAAGEDIGRQFKRNAHNVESPDWTRLRIEA